METKRHTFIASFKPAFAGLWYALKSERNFQIETGAGLIVLITMFVLPLTFAERATIFLTIGFVLVAEIMNTSFERLLDLVKPEIHPEVKIIKDMTAGAVLVAALTSILVGLSIFLPYLV